MARKISRSLINGRVGAGTGGQGLKVEWDSTNDGELHWKDVSESSLEYVAPKWYGDRGIFHHGRIGTNDSDTISYINITSTGNGTDFGNRTEARRSLASVSSGTRAVAGGGEAGYSNTLDYITISTTGNATDYGDLLEAREYNTDGFGNVTRGLFAGGKSGATTKDDIQYITIATTGNATDFGDLYVAVCCGIAAASNGTRGVVAGGYNYQLSAYQNVIQYVTIDTTGNATDFGDLTAGKASISGCSSETRGVFVGGYTTGWINEMEYITIATTGNATDFGDLTFSVHTKGTANDTRGVVTDCSAASPTIDYFTIATTGNASNFGNMLEKFGGGAATSGD